MFSTFPKTDFNFQSHIFLFSANAFSLEQSKLLSFDLGLNVGIHYENQTCLDDMMSFVLNQF